MLKYIVIILTYTILSCTPHPEEDCGFAKNQFNRRISWGQQLPVLVRIDPSIPENLRPDIYLAANKWNSGFGRELIRIVEKSNNAIYGIKDWQSNPAMQAITNVRYYADTIYESNIYINIYGFPFKSSKEKHLNGIDFQSLTIHEFGHLLGIDHKDGTVMDPMLGMNEIRDVIESDILKNMNCEYNRWVRK